jgi:hypothetical protein
VSAVLRMLPRRLRGDLLIGTQHAERPAPWAAQHTAEPNAADCSSRVFAERSSPVRPGVAGGAVFMTAGEQGANDAVAKWYGWVQAYMAERPGLWATPPKGIRSMARAMSVAETGSTDHERRFVGIASETCRLIRQTARAEHPVRQDVAGQHLGGAKTTIADGSDEDVR